jgi:stage III sporulation protein AG
MKWKQLFLENPRIAKLLERYKWVLLVVAAGLVLLLLPTGHSKQNGQMPDQKQAPSSFDLAELEQRYSDALSEITGAGEVKVVLSVKTGMRQILAEDSKYAQKENGMEESTSTVVLSRGSGVQETVKLQEIYPQFQGALIICSGGEDPAVRLKLTEATAALTGLGTNKISICSRGK